MSTVPHGQPSGGHVQLSREVLDAFISAAREGDFEALREVLDPDVVLRADRAAVSIGASRVVRGAANVARQALAFSRPDPERLSQLDPTILD